MPAPKFVLNAVVGVSAAVLAGAALVPHTDESGPVLKAAVAFVGARPDEGSSPAAGAAGPPVIRLLIIEDIHGDDWCAAHRGEAGDA